MAAFLRHLLLKQHICVFLWWFWYHLVLFSKSIAGDAKNGPIIRKALRGVRTVICPNVRMYSTYIFWFNVKNHLIAFMHVEYMLCAIFSSNHSISWIYLLVLMFIVYSQYIWLIKSIRATSYWRYFVPFSLFQKDAFISSLLSDTNIKSQPQMLLLCRKVLYLTLKAGKAYSMWYFYLRYSVPVMRLHLFLS